MGFGDYTEHKLVPEEKQKEEEAKAKAKAKEEEVRGRARQRSGPPCPALPSHCRRRSRRALPPGAEEHTAGLISGCAPVPQVDVRREAKMWKRKNADQRVKRTFKTADEVLKVQREGRGRRLRGGKEGSAGGKAPAALPPALPCPAGLTWHAPACAALLLCLPACPAGVRGAAGGGGAADDHRHAWAAGAPSHKPGAPECGGGARRRRLR